MCPFFNKQSATLPQRVIIMRLKDDSISFMNKCDVLLLSGLKLYSVTTDLFTLVKVHESIQSVNNKTHIMEWHCLYAE